MFSLKALFILALLSFALTGSARATLNCAVCSTPEFQPQRQLSAFAEDLPRPALGEKKLLYIRLSYADDPAEPISVATAEALMSDVSSWFLEHSHGKFTTRATITALLKLPLAKKAYFPKDSNGRITPLATVILDHARNAAKEAGYDLAEYDLHMLRFNAPILQSFAWIGLPQAWLVTSHPATTIHEIGHNLGLRHANRWDGDVNGAGSNVEYGDNFDIMGNPPFYESAGFNAVNKLALGWLSQANTIQITNSGIYRLRAHDLPALESAAPCLLRVRKDAERDYWIEKRVRMDMYEHMEKSGLLVYWDAWSQSNEGTQLIGLADAPGESIPIHTALNDDDLGVKIIPIRQAPDRSWMDVAVLFGRARLNLLSGFMHYSAAPARSYRFEVSTDLRHWTGLTQTSSPTGELFVPIDNDEKQAFYRVVELPDFK